MKIFLYLTVFLIILAVSLFVWTQVQAQAIAEKYPPSGKIASLSGGDLHFKEVKADTADVPTVLFVHGASGNLLDQYHAYLEPLRGKARMVFVDRPGYGYSVRNGSDNPAKQAARYLELLDSLKIDQVTLVGHSLGTASVAAFAVLYPNRVKGVVFVAPATHPWNTGVTWYYDVGSLPIIGSLFTNTLVLPIGQASVEEGAKKVFDPQEAPFDYAEKAAVPLILRPFSFQANAADVAGLNEFVSDFSKRYDEIKAPVIIITGDADDIVAPSIHSVGLEKDIEGAELIVLPGVGHKPDYVAVETVVEAIGKVSR